MQTEEARYDELVDRVEVLYNDGRLRGAIGLVDDSEGLEAWAAELAHLKACLLAAAGDTESAFRTLQDASDAGAWWDPSILTGDDDLAALQVRREFRQLVATSRERVADDPTPPLVELPAVPAVGVVVALHGAGQRASHAARDWAAVLDLGYALVCVESSRRMSPMYRTWPDREQAAGDIARALAAVPAELSAVPTIAAGFSAGGRAALDWALTAHPVKVAGVVVMAPALRTLPDAAAGPLSPATILVGTGDGLLEVVENAAGRLTAFGCAIERVPGLAHTFPADFGRRLRTILS
ncbi:putative esterase [Kribbella antiqua]|uniref:Putative esterase n=1 Tax=Kribbella antiqua TaxID=2512217 RepID=A0A4R2IJA7_9ACTN|nr:alpha/beta hydrolase [Kribbella antiqua]TCO43919.1 putative esterase [Kribbella antiqua]